MSERVSKLKTMEMVLRALTNAQVENRKEVREWVKQYKPGHLENVNMFFKRGWLKRNRLHGYDLSQTGFLVYNSELGQQNILVRCPKCYKRIGYRAERKDREKFTHTRITCDSCGCVFGDTYKWRR